MVGEIFEKNYQYYCDRIAELDFTSIKERLGTESDRDQMKISFIDRDYLVSKKGVTDASGNRPDYMVCVILAKYLLLTPDKSYNDTEWVSFKDFKRASHFTNTNFFSSDTEQVIVKNFSGRVNELSRAGKALGGIDHELRTSYDLAMEFIALPRISLLLLFNEKEEAFPANCSLLFQKHAEFYLDPESLALTSACLAKCLKKTDQNTRRGK